jgi:hypothetical protein
LFIGLIGGSIGSVILVANINRNALKKKKIGKKGSNGLPTSGSPLNSLDEEKFV